MQHTTRKQSAKSKRNKNDPAEWEIMVGSTNKGGNTNLSENTQYSTSDLEDCPQIWEPELSNYILECQKRQHQVDSWFEDVCLVIALFKY